MNLEKKKAEEIRGTVEQIKQKNRKTEQIRKSKIV
jgi:hypothetical protein